MGGIPTTLCERFPKAALQFLDKVVGEDAQKLPEDMVSCLQAILDVVPEMRHDPAFKRLEGAHAIA